MVFGSETSSRKVMDFMQKKELHGQIPVVTPCSRQALNQFEMQARKGEMGLQNGGQLAYLGRYTDRVVSLPFPRPERPCTDISPCCECAE